MNIKFKPNDQIICIGSNWTSEFPDGRVVKSVASITPVKDKIYTVEETRSNGQLVLKEIPYSQNGYDLTWSQNAFEKLIEEKVRYVVVEVDKKVKEKRGELIFNN